MSVKIKKLEMNCKELIKILPSYINGKTGVEQSNLITEHIEICSECSLKYKQVSHSLDLLSYKKDINEQAFYYTRLKQKMLNKSNKEPILSSFLFKKILQPSIYLASLIIAVYIGILIGSGSTNDMQFTEINYDNEDYIQSYTKYQYLNDLEIENNNNILLKDTIN
ncbi:MAG: zf-HC2 domain-containing protein [Bacteroidales bacterium]|nr:zf-HC2 domain-containing protein [Bacteroidales bacterium]